MDSMMNILFGAQAPDLGCPSRRSGPAQPERHEDEAGEDEVDLVALHHRGGETGDLKCCEAVETARAHDRGHRRTSLVVLGSSRPAARLRFSDKNDLIATGCDVDPEDLATITPYITSKIRRFGDCKLDLTSPPPTVAGSLDLAR
jgi:hypothetical protein